jgi:hypothetical protein
MSTISTIITHEVSLSGTGTYTSPLDITSTGGVEVGGGYAVYGGGTKSWTVENSGTVTDSNGTAILFRDGGYVGNLAGTALIAGGVDIAAGTITIPSTVINAGTITDNVIAVEADGSAVVRNTGTGTIAGFSAEARGVIIERGYVYNAAGATISAGWYGVKSRSTGTLVNHGNITAGIGGGAYLGFGGSIDNTGTITGSYGVAISNAVGSITNTDTIIATNSADDGVSLDGGSIDNTGVILGPHTGILVSGTSGSRSTLTNTGTIVANSSAAGIGIDFDYGGSIYNSGLIAGVEEGIIAGDLITMTEGGRVLNFGLVSGTERGIDGTGNGSVQNSGTIIGGSDGVQLSATDGTLDNFAYIFAMATGGTGLSIDVTTGSAYNYGVIAGGTGVYWSFSAGDVVNKETIAGTAGIGVKLEAGGYVKNFGSRPERRAALIYGYAEGIYAANLRNNAGTVANAGTIEGTGSSGIGIEFLNAAISTTAPRAR